MSFFSDITKNALARGLTIHPVHPGQKKAILADWPGKASKNPAVIDLWSDNFPTANYGVVASDEICILESDNAQELLKQLGGLPETYTVQASENRPHYYFRQTAESRELRNLTRRGLFELKHHNAYVVGEGSLHPSGAEYKCVNPAEIADFPAGLAHKLRLIYRGLAPVELSSMGEGDGRQPTLTTAASLLWDGEKTREQFITELQEINQEFGAPKDEGSVESIVDWFMEREPHVKPVIATLRAPWGKSLRESIDITKDNKEREPFMIFHKDGKDAVMFQKASLNQIVAWRGLGKTNFALRLAGSLATGTDFLLFRSPHARRVVYVDGELPFNQLVERAQRHCVGADGTPALDNVTLINPEILPAKHSIDLSDEEQLDELVRTLTAHRAEVVILDSQGILMKGDSLDHGFQENHNRLLLELRLLGLCVIELHHTGKNKDSQRGRSGNDDLLDFQMYLKEPADREEGEGLRFEVEIGKCRHYPEPTGGYELFLRDQKWGWQELTSLKRVAEMFAEGKCTNRKVASELNISLSTVSRLKARAIKSGLLDLNNKVNKEKM